MYVARHLRLGTRPCRPVSLFVAVSAAALMPRTWAMAPVRRRRCGLMSDATIRRRLTRCSRFSVYGFAESVRDSSCPTTPRVENHALAECQYQVITYALKTHICKRSHCTMALEAAACGAVDHVRCVLNQVQRFPPVKSNDQAAHRNAITVRAPAPDIRRSRGGHGSASMN